MFQHLNAEHVIEISICKGECTAIVVGNIRMLTHPENVDPSRNRRPNPRTHQRTPHQASNRATGPLPPPRRAHALAMNEVWGAEIGKWLVIADRRGTAAQ